MLRIIFLGSALILISMPVNAAQNGSGTGCSSTHIGPVGYQKAAQIASKLSSYLERKYAKNGTRVVLLGRAGSDSPRKRFAKKVNKYWDYTHGGLAYRDHPQGLWSVVHLLNDCGEKSSIYSESLMKFFLDDPFEYRVVVGIPSAELQEKLHLLIIERNMGAAFHDGSIYSSISNPFNTQRQNSNEYLLDTFVAAIAHLNGNTSIFTREQSKTYMLANNLNAKVIPERAKVKGIESFGLALGFGPKNATVDDHPREERRGGAVNIVSVGTLLEFLSNTDNLVSTTELALQDMTKAGDTRYSR